MKHFTLFLLILLLSLSKMNAQYPGAAGTVGSTAVFKDSTIFKSWATGCILKRGFQDITDTSLGYASVGNYPDALGKAGTNGVVSLGDAGEAVLTFESPIRNGAGADFAVFENSFSDFFLELAFVEVSSDGQHYVRFPAYSNTQIDTQIWLTYGSDPTKIHNLAGKYRALYGTPFDLDELKDSIGIDINAITHIKLIDVVGDITPVNGRLDANNRPINDPFPTPYPSSGFDLDAVGVIHQQPLSINEYAENMSFSVYPNPFQEILQVYSPHNEFVFYSLFSTEGKLLKTTTSDILEVRDIAPGIYFLEMGRKDFSMEKIKVVKW